MKHLRKLIATVSILFGVIALIVWALAFFAVKTIEDGSVVTNLASSALNNPAVTNLVTEAAQELVGDSLEGEGLDLSAIGLDGTVDDVISSFIGSDSFQNGIADAVGAAHADFTDQLTGEDRAPAPLSVNLDLSSILGEELQDQPVLGALVPDDLVVPPIAVQVLDASSFERVRDVYSWIAGIAKVAGWIGLGLILFGILVSPNKRWILPKFLLGLGIASTMAWLLVATINVERLAAFIPGGGADGTIGSAIVDFIPQETIDGVAVRILQFGIGSFVASLALYFLVKALSRKKSSRRDHDEQPAPAAHVR